MLYNCICFIGTTVVLFGNNGTYCRTWELMTMGTIVVLEKAVGFDRTVSFEAEPVLG